MKRLQKLANPALVLFFLAPAIGELLSRSAPPAEFFNPFSFLILGILYGGGAIIIRELTERWKKGWMAILAGIPILAARILKRLTNSWQPVPELHL